MLVSGKYENVFTQEYHIPWGQRPRGIWYSWVNKFSYFLNPHAINVLLYRMKPRKHIYVKYCWQTYFKSIGTLSQTFKNHCNGRLQVMRSECLWRFPVKERKSGGKTREASEGVEYDFYFTEYDFCSMWPCVLIFIHCPIRSLFVLSCSFYFVHCIVLSSWHRSCHMYNISYTKENRWSYLLFKY
jgi:hypothetical protein